MLRRSTSILAADDSSSSTTTRNSNLLKDDQENYSSVNFDGGVASPNRTKYEKKFLHQKVDRSKKSSGATAAAGGVTRRPLEEKTNKFNSSNSTVVSSLSLSLDDNEHELDLTDRKCDSKTTTTMVKNNITSNAAVTFEDLFTTTTTSSSPSLTSTTSSSSSSSHNSTPPQQQSNSNTINSNKIEELTMALADTLKENEELHDTVTLLKAENDRLNGELDEYKEYAELYLMTKELLEEQAKELENLKKQ